MGATTGAPVYVEFADGARASYGGDEFLFVELSESMSLPTALRIQAMAKALEPLDLPGIIDVCPSHVSYMIRYDPDVLEPGALVTALRGLHESFPAAAEVQLDTEIIEIPVLYDDPWTTEVLLRFRSRHQSPAETDIEYSARINGFDSVGEFIRQHSSKPFIVTFPCFVPGNAECVQLVPRDRQIETPKYLSPRTDTPARALGHGGAFSTVYPAAGAGGYQLIGRSAVPVVDMQQRLPGFERSIVIAAPSTIFKFTAIDLDEYYATRSAVESGAHHYRKAPVRFVLQSYLDDPDGYTDGLLKELP